MRLSLATLGEAAPAIRKPAFEPAKLGIGIVHLGVGAFHRAHQCVFTDDAIEAAGGDWGIVGVSMRKPDVAEALAPQDGLFTVETLAQSPSYRVIGALRGALVLPQAAERIINVIADVTTHAVTLTITEKGYCLKGDELDFSHPDIANDIITPSRPRSAVGLLAAALGRRRDRSGAPITVISCDNLGDNGARLGRAIAAFAERSDPQLAKWIESETAFPQTMVDSIVPAATAAARTRVNLALGLDDEASVQREPFAQWVIENRFAGPRPQWDRAGAEIVEDVAPYRRIKLHVLNATHSALAYLGLARGHTYVREAIADPDLRSFLEPLIEEEIAPALPDLPVRRYWQATAQRFANPMVDHRLDQIAQDGAFKLAERVHPLMIANAQAQRPVKRLGAIVRAWIDYEHRSNPQISLYERLRDPAIFADPFRLDQNLREAIVGAFP